MAAELQPLAGVTGLRFKLPHAPFQGKTGLLQLTGQEASKQ